MKYEKFVDTIFNQMTKVIIHDEKNKKVKESEYHKLIDNPDTNQPEYTLFFDVTSMNIKMLGIYTIPSEKLIALPYYSNYMPEYKNQLNELAENFVRQGSANVLNRNVFFDKKLKEAYVAKYVNFETSNNMLQAR
jgi:hypothetical protein